MSSKYATAPGIPLKILSIAAWKIAGLEDKPNGKRLRRINPLWVDKVNKCCYSSATTNCWYALDKSIQLKIAQPAMDAKMSSAEGRG